MATIYPFISTFENLLMPGGFYLSSSLKPVDMSWIDPSFGYFHTGDKVMSLWGGLVAETGIVGFLLLLFAMVLLIRKIMMLPKSMRNEYYLIIAFLFLLGFSSITISLAPIPFVISLMISKINRSIAHLQK